MSLTFNACSEEKEELDITADYTYFPLEVGKYWVYEVDSMVYRIGGRDSTRTLVKEEITDYFIDNKGDTVYRVDQYERKNILQPWEIKRVISLSRNETQAIRTENNISLIKLVFPLRQSTNWNSTVLVNPTLMVTTGGEVEIFKFWESEVENTGKALSFNNTAYEETATIFHAQRDVGIEYRYAKEIYAKNIGLIQREWWILDSQCTTCGTAWKDKAQKGFIIQQRLVEHN